MIEQDELRSAPLAEAGRHFLLRPDVTFLNHGSYGACPAPVFETYQRWQRELESEPVEFLGRRIRPLLAEALRDVTATVESIPLIAASIMSKKLAIGPSHLLLDVKVGAGAFMKNEADARLLAETMARIGEDAGVRTVALLSAMEQPLGRAVGNALEIVETVAILRGEGPEDITDLCVHEVATLLVMAGLARDEAEGERRAHKAITDGAGLAKLREVVAAQGGDPAQIDDPGLLPQARWVGMIEAPRSGYIAAIHAEKVGVASVRLGAGRARKGDPIDPSVGFILQAKVGDHVEKGQPLIEVHARTATAGKAVRSALLAAYTWSDERVAVPPLLLGSTSSAERY